MPSPSKKTEHLPKIRIDPELAGMIDHLRKRRPDLNLSAFVRTAVEEALNREGLFRRDHVPPI